LPNNRHSTKFLLIRTIIKNKTKMRSYGYIIENSHLLT